MELMIMHFATDKPSMFTVQLYDLTDVIWLVVI